MAKFKMRENQYVPRNAKLSPSGFPLGSTYYYFVNEQGKVVDKMTLKPYRGKDLKRYAYFSKFLAEFHLHIINSEN
jgi:aminoglycoside phosphotransferase (APT) family kinase protein